MEFKIKLKQAIGVLILTPILIAWDREALKDIW
ncbi:unnamed protein product, partial [marine sediment metagenome]